MPEILGKVIADKRVRTELTTNSHMWFFHVYFANYVKYATADFQREMFALTEDETKKLDVIVAFRGSGKSTIMTMSYPIWAILGKQRKKFVVIIGQTQQQAKLHLTNLRRELEANSILRADLGPFEEKDEEWSSGSLVIPKHNARITALSTEQSIRGLRHGATRPDLIICDDVEDLASVRTREGRDKTHQWFVGDVVPCGDVTTKVVVVGNLLHEDSLIMRIKQDMQEGKLSGTFNAYPLVNKDEKTLWSGKYPSAASVAALKLTIGDEIAWQREYMLKIVSDASRLVDPSWIIYYDKFDPPEGKHVTTSVGMDLAISEKESADCTAMVAAKSYGCMEQLKIFILPNPINARLNFPNTMQEIKTLVDALGGKYRVNLYIEEVGYQSALIQVLEKEGYQVKGARPNGGDKRSRIAIITHLIRNGVVLFPKKGAETLIQQLTGFGTEKYDDLADAFAILVGKIKEMDKLPPRIYWI